MGESWPQERPGWCLHPTCCYRMSSQDALCFGELPKPEPHGDGLNTHRMCMRGGNDDGEWTFDVQINRGDAWHFYRLIRGVFGFGDAELAELRAKVRLLMGVTHDL